MQRKLHNFYNQLILGFLKISKSGYLLVLALLFLSFQNSNAEVASDTFLEVEDPETVGLWAKESFGLFNAEIELVDRRSENEKHFQRGDGKVDMFVSSDPINYLENGKWKTIYNTIAEDNNGIYKFSNLNNTFKSYYPENIQDGFKTVINGQELLEMRNATMYYEMNGQKMAVQEIESANGVANGNELTYTNVYGNAIDLLVTQSGGKRKLDYIIRDRAAINTNLSNAQYLVFSEEIALPHGWSAKLENGVIYLVDGTGKVASVYEMPVVFDNNQNLPEKDSKGTAEFVNTSGVVKAKMNSKGAIQNHEDIYIDRNIAYEIELLGNKLTVLTKVELTYLLDENRVYPVIVDPTLTATHNPNSWSYSFGAPYGPPPITTSGAPAGSAITNTNVSFNALNNAFYYYGWNFYSGYCGSWHSYGLFDLTPGSPNYGSGPTAIINNCGGNTNWFNCNDPNRTWLSELISMDGYDYAAYYGFTVTVTYETVSAPTAINGTSTICAGSSTTLTASGGSASAGSTSITTQWFSGSCGGTLIGTGNSITVSPTTTTTYYVRRVGQCSTTGCASVTVNVIPTATAGTVSAGTTPQCEGSSTTYTVSGVELGGGTGAWSSDNASVATVNSSTGVVTAVGAGTCSIIYTVTGGCGGTKTASASYTVDANPFAANAGEDKPACINNSATLSASNPPVGSGTWTWSPSAPSYAGGTSASDYNAQVVFNAVGQYTGTWTVTNGICTSTPDDAVVTVTSANNNASLFASAGAATESIFAFEVCEEGPWTYYAASGTPDEYLFAINKNGNSFSAVVSITDLPGTTSISSLGGNQQIRGTWLIGRYWNVELFSGSVTTPVDVRFFVDPAEVTQAENEATSFLNSTAAATNMTSLTFFKTVSTAFDPSTSLVNGEFTFAPAYLPYTTGTLNGVTYYELTGLTSFSGGTGGFSVNDSGSPLPVELLGFDVNAVDNQFIRLDWATASEINNEGFEVLRSKDGVNFERIAWIDGNGNSTEINEYVFNDRGVDKGMTYYYQLKQIDYDGQYEYFDIKSARLDGRTTFSVGALVPNPSKGNDIVSVDVATSSGELLTVEIYDRIGTKVKSMDYVLFTAENALDINISELAEGTYFLNFASSMGTETRKLVVLK